MIIAGLNVTHEIMQVDNCVGNIWIVNVRNVEQECVVIYALIFYELKTYDPQEYVQIVE